MLASVHTGASVSLWRGVAERAAELDVDLLIFPVGRIGAKELDESMRNRLIELIARSGVDGLLSWASSLSGMCGPEDVAALHARFGHLPMVALAQDIEGASSLHLDDYQGMMALLGHLYDAHGYRRIAFIRGPERHLSANERYKAYRDFLSLKGLAFDPLLVSSPLPWDEGSTALAEFLDERRLMPGVSFQAVAAASDLLAFWFLRGVQDRGYQVPADIAVVGVNDSAESLLSAPPLTTLAMPFREQGSRGLSLLHELWEGGGGPARVVLPVSLVVRESCGCLSVEAELAGAAEAEHEPEHLAGQPSAMAARLVNGMAGAHMAEAPALAPGGAGERPELLDGAVAEAARAAGLGEAEGEAWIRPLAQAFAEELSGGPKRFLAMLARILDRVVHGSGREGSWQNALSALRSQAWRLAPAAERAQVVALISRARVMIGQAIARHGTFSRWAAEEDAKRLRSLGRAMLMSYGIEGIAALLAERLPAIGIRHAYLTLSGDAGDAGSRLVLAMRDGKRLSLPPEGRAIGDAECLPADVLPESRHTLLVEALHAGSEALGYLALDAGPDNGIVYEELRGFASSAIKGALLFKEAQGARARAERSDRVKTRLLANVSHELRTPLGLIIDEAARERPDLGKIADNARYQMKLVNDLMDLSRAEIEEIDLAREYIDPLPLLADCFASFKDGRKAGLEWLCELPERLPLILVDPARIRQILYNLLENARRHTERGSVTLSASLEPPWLAISVRDTGAGIARDRLEAVFEPFFTEGSGSAGGVGLGLAIARQLALLHGGSIDLESEEGRGSEFRLMLPLPRLGHGAAARGFSGGAAGVASAGENSGSVAAMARPGERLVVIGFENGLPPGVERLAGATGLACTRVASQDDEAWQETSGPPSAIVLDAAAMSAQDWKTLRRMRRDPRLVEAPLMLFAGQGAQGGVKGIALKQPGAERDLSLLIEAGCEPEARGPMLVVDDDAYQRSRTLAALAKGFPAAARAEASSVAEALAFMAGAVPCLLILDLVMPGMGGEALLEAMKADERLRNVPVIVLTNKLLTEEDLRRLDRHSRLVVQSKGVWTDEELARMAGAAIDDELASAASPVVKLALAWMLRNFERPFSRWQLAEAVNVSEDHLSRAFHRELGLGVWDFLNRYRIHRAKELLSATSLPVGTIAAKVGYNDQSYFCRVFRKLSGLSPQAYRERS